MLKASGAQGGLIVHLGCGDGRLTAALGRNNRYLVHGLESDAAMVGQARRHFRAEGLCGRVSVSQLRVPRDEMMRVLAPRGVLVDARYVSTDLVHWQERPIGLYPDRTGSMHSGSAAVDWHNSGGFQEGDTAAIIAAFTGSRGLRGHARVLRPARVQGARPSGHRRPCHVRPPAGP